MIDTSLKDMEKEYDMRLDEDKQHISHLTAEKDELKADVSPLKFKIEQLKRRDDEMEQYSHRNLIRITGLKEDVKRKTDKIVLDIAESINIDVTPSDIDSLHKVCEW